MDFEFLSKYNREKREEFATLCFNSLRYSWFQLTHSIFHLSALSFPPPVWPQIFSRWLHIPTVFHFSCVHPAPLPPAAGDNGFLSWAINVRDNTLGAAGKGWRLSAQWWFGRSRTNKATRCTFQYVNICRVSTARLTEQGMPFLWSVFTQVLSPLWLMYQVPDLQNIFAWPPVLCCCTLSLPSLSRL